MSNKQNENVPNIYSTALLQHPNLVTLYFYFSLYTNLSLFRFQIYYQIFGKNVFRKPIESITLFTHYNSLYKNSSAKKEN